MAGAEETRVYTVFSDKICLTAVEKPKQESQAVLTDVSWHPLGFILPWTAACSSPGMLCLQKGSEAQPFLFSSQRVRLGSSMNPLLQSYSKLYSRRGQKKKKAAQQQPVTSFCLVGWKSGTDQSISKPGIWLSDLYYHPGSLQLASSLWTETAEAFPVLGGFYALQPVKAASEDCLVGKGNSSDTASSTWNNDSKLCWAHFWSAVPGSEWN